MLINRSGTMVVLNGVLIAVIEMVMVHNLEGKRNKMIYIFSGVALGSIGYILLNILSPGAFAAIIVVIIITFSEILAMPFMNSFWISRTTVHNRGEHAALYSMSWSAAQIIAPFLGSNVIFYGGFSLLWWVLGAVSMLSAIGYWWMYYRSTAKYRTLNVE